MLASSFLLLVAEHLQHRGTAHRVHQLGRRGHDVGELDHLGRHAELRGGDHAAEAAQLGDELLAQLLAHAGAGHFLATLVLREFGADAQRDQPVGETLDDHLVAAVLAAHHGEGVVLELGQAAEAAFVQGEEVLVPAAERLPHATLGDRFEHDHRRARLVAGRRRGRCGGVRGVPQDGEPPRTGNQHGRPTPLLQVVVFLGGVPVRVLARETRAVDEAVALGAPRRELELSAARRVHLRPGRLLHPAHRRAGDVGGGGVADVAVEVILYVVVLFPLGVAVAVVITLVVLVLGVFARASREEGGEVGLVEVDARQLVGLAAARHLGEDDVAQVVGELDEALLDGVEVVEDVGGHRGVFRCDRRWLTSHT